MDRLLTMISEDPAIGPALRAAHAPQRFEFDDLDLVMNMSGCAPGESANLRWAWTDEVEWEPRVRMAMSSEVVNRYFQGRENVALALARRRIRPAGDVRASIALIPVVKPIYPRYRAMLAERYPHLVV